MPRLHGAHPGSHNRLGCRKVRLTHLQMDNIAALLLQLLRLLHQHHYVE